MITNFENKPKSYTKRTSYTLGSLKINFENEKIEVVQDSTTIVIPKYLAHDILEVFKLELEPMTITTPVYRGLQDFEKEQEERWKPYKEFKTSPDFLNQGPTSGEYKPNPSITLCNNPVDDLKSTDTGYFDR